MKDLQTYYESLNQVPAYKDSFPDGIKPESQYSEDILCADICNFPPTYLNPLEYDRPIDLDGLNAVADWTVRVKNRTARNCLLIDGGTGQGKTRSAIMAGIALGFECDSELFSGAIEFRYNHALDFAKKAGKPHGKPFESTGTVNIDFDDGDDEDEYNPKLWFAGLILDDLDKVNFSERVLSELLYLINHAEQHDRPIIITMQTSIEELIQKMMKRDPDGMKTTAQSIIRRILDRFESIHFKK